MHALALFIYVRAYMTTRFQPNNQASPRKDTGNRNEEGQPKYAEL